MTRRLQLILCAVLMISGSGLWYAMAAENNLPIPEIRAAAKKTFDAGNFKDAYGAYHKLVLDERNENTPLASDLEMAWQCLQRLNRTSEQDGLLQGAVEAHPNDARVWWKAAQLLHQSEHYGFRVAGEFQRGRARGGGEYVQSFERDRVQSLRWMQKAAALIDGDLSGAELADFWNQYAQLWSANRMHQQAWRLQALTDLNELPDYDQVYYGRGRGWGGGENKGAAVDADGNPIFHHIPDSLDAAESDGERWRYCLEQVVEAQPNRRSDVDYQFANFLQSQFGVQTLQQWGIVLPREGDAKEGEADAQTSLVSLKTLGEDETIARLANGVKRFKLPDEFNFIRIYQKIDAGSKPGHDAAQQQLAQVFENRQQYEKAAEWRRRNLEQFGKNDNGQRQRQLDQIIGHWGQFEPVVTQPAGQGATVEYRFRNGNHVSFEAHALKIPELLEDVKAYLESKPSQLDWQKLQIDNIGYQIVQENQKKYLGERVAQWSLDLEPRPQHFDRRITVTTPLQKAGAYLVTAKMKDGNTSRIILWLDDTAIAKKQLNGQVLYYVADSVSGKPIEKANVEFFGWRNEHIPNTKRDFRTITRQFAEFSDANGLVLLKPDQMENNMQWLVIARTDSGRFAHLGFTGVWYGRYQHQQYQQHKIYVVTDRPVYRPSQKVQFKFWAGEAKYDAPDQNPWAGKKFTVKIHDPQGTEISSQDLTADEYGGFAGTFELGEEAALGQYSLIAHHPNLSGHGSFRVEEYKKPEFEVTVKAPEKPVQLGEKVTATIRAKYYFGAPVQHAKVSFKVERSSHETRWYPAMPWDWLYGDGYWWFAGDYTWYPGFGRWGCVAPRPHWIHWNPAPPELVLDQEVEIGEDGTVEVEIDTALAKALHGDEDHEYKITAEVTDASRRTIVGTGQVLVAREPFKVFTWVDRGHYRVGDTIHAHFQSRTPDGQGVQGTGKLKLLKIRYDNDGNPTENVAQEWDLNPNDDGYADLQIKATEAGQYRLSYSLTSEGDNGKTIEGGYLFVIRGEGFDGSEFQFNDLELITNKREYAPGEKVELLINTNRVGSTVLLFVRPENGVYQGPPQVIHLAGKSTSVDVAVAQADMPNFFVEAVTIAAGKVHTVAREVVVPPEKRVLNVEVLPSEERYSPGEEADIRIKITDSNGEPFVGSTALAVYDRSVEYISGGSNVPEIREFFWKWQRRHHPQTEHNLQRSFWQLIKQGEQAMANLGVFGGMIADVDEKLASNRGREQRKGVEMQMGRQLQNAAPAAAPMAGMAFEAADALADAKGFVGGDGGAGGGDLVQPTVRSNFADTAYWNGMLTTNKRGIAKVSFNMPENLTGWKLRAWGVGNGTRVGEGTTEVVTAKDLLVRLQAPRFFVEKDEVVLSAIVHNYLPEAKDARVELKLEGGTLEAMAGFENAQMVNIPAGGEVRVDWRCKAIAEGNATITMSALTNEESDAMQVTFPVFVHGFLKTESFSGVIRAGQNSGTIEINVPTDRRPEQSRLEIRYSPTLAGAMVDALPYLVSYPYGCTEQTLNRFVPTVITQRILQRMNLDLTAIRDKRTNLNAQEIGDDAERAKRWKHWDHNPVFDAGEVTSMVKKGVEDLTAMQNADGGWGWFSGYGERSYPHTTAVVVHGLQLAQKNDIALVPGMLEKGLVWLHNYQSEQVKLLKEAEHRETLDDKQRRERKVPYKSKADNTDALVFMILCESDDLDTEMQRYLFRDRLSLTLYSQAVLGLALHEIGAAEQRDMVITNIDQFVTVDNENQTAFIDLPNNNGWWYWHGNTIEANAFYLKLLSRVKPKDAKAAGLVKYLLNNRRHATYWNNTRDTAYCIEALAEYLTASGEGEPNTLVEVWIDGELKQSVEITPEVLFSFDNKFVLEGEALASGPHKVELRTKPLQGDESKTPLYFNAYLTNFSTEDFITKAGLEIKVQRKFFKLVQREGATDQVQGDRGQVIDQKALKYDRIELPNLSEVTSGDLIEIELEIDSKNDYEYVVFEDFKAAGCEPVDVRSGYTRGGLGAYVEFRDEKVAFFMRTLARGKHSVSYQLRAEVPGKFSALPTNGYAMYAPELKANSDEMKLRIADGE